VGLSAAIKGGRERGFGGARTEESGRRATSRGGGRGGGQANANDAVACE